MLKLTRTRRIILGATLAMLALTLLFPVRYTGQTIHTLFLFSPGGFVVWNRTLAQMAFWAVLGASAWSFSREE